MKSSGSLDDAFEHYMNVVYNYFIERESGEPVRWLWFTRAAFSAAAIRESQASWHDATKIYERVVDAGVPAAPDAQIRIHKILYEVWKPSENDKRSKT